MDQLETKITQRLEAFKKKCEVVQSKLDGNSTKRLVDCLLDGSVYAVIMSLEHLQDLKET